MIDWDKTYKIYGYKKSDRIPKKQKIVLKCDFCNSEQHYSKQTHYMGTRRNNGKYRCKECGYKSPKFSQIAKENWKDPEYRRIQENKTHSDELKKLASERSKKLWKDPEYIKKYNDGFDPKIARMNFDLARDKSVDASRRFMKERWDNTEYHQKMSKQSTELWSLNEYRQKVISGLKDYYSSSEVLKEASERSKRLWKSNDYRENWFKSFMESFTSDRRDQISVQSSRNWLDRDYRNKIESYWDDEKREWMSKVCSDWWSDERRSEISDLMIERWSDPEFRDKFIKAFIDSWTPERRQKAKDSWTPEMREKASERSRKLWENPEYVKKHLEVLLRPSSLEIQFAEMLREYDIEYESQYHIGPYIFDFKINNILVEIQGDYWHNLDKTIIKDKAKATYIEKYHQEYKLLYLWEHEFYSVNRVKSFIESNFRHPPLVDFSFKDLEIKSMDFNIVKSFLEKYHYKGGAGRSGTNIVVYYYGNVIAACIIASPTRNVDGGELTRFCIHPRYHKKNFGSWFLSRAVKFVKNKYTRLISFADPNFNHDGTLYRASGWNYVGDTKPDYWYCSSNGWVMHKKTLYNRAKNLCMKEKEFAEVYDYRKVWGLPKKKYELILNK